MKNIYAILDRLSGQIVGGIHLMAHDAPAVRFFGDIASDPQTMIHRHIQDHDLLCLGALDEENHAIISDSHNHRVVITGLSWKATQATLAEKPE